MALTDLKIRTAKPKEKPYKLADEKGLYLLINPNGSKYWRLKYRYYGKEKALALGVYNETTLAQARRKSMEKDHAWLATISIGRNIVMAFAHLALTKCSPNFASIFL